MLFLKPTLYTLLGPNLKVIFEINPFQNWWLLLAGNIIFINRNSSCKYSSEFDRHKDPYVIQIPVKDMTDPKKKKKTTLRLPMLLPHELLNWLHESWIWQIDIYFFVLISDLQNCLLICNALRQTKTRTRTKYMCRCLMCNNFGNIGMIRICHTTRQLKKQKAMMGFCDSRLGFRATMLDTPLLDQNF